MFGGREARTRGVEARMLWVSFSAEEGTFQSGPKGQGRASLAQMELEVGPEEGPCGRSVGSAARRAQETRWGWGQGWTLSLEAGAYGREAGCYPVTDREPRHGRPLSARIPVEGSRGIGFHLGPQLCRLSDCWPGVAQRMPDTSCSIRRGRRFLPLVVRSLHSPALDSVPFCLSSSRGASPLSQSPSFSLWCIPTSWGDIGTRTG